MIVLGWDLGEQPARSAVVLVASEQVIWYDHMIHSSKGATVQTATITLTRLSREVSNLGINYGEPHPWHISPDDISSVSEKPNPMIGSSCLVHLGSGQISIPVAETWPEIEERMRQVLETQDQLAIQVSCASCSGSGDCVLCRGSGVCQVCQGIRR